MVRHKFCDLKNRKSYLTDDRATGKRALRPCPRAASADRASWTAS